MRAVALAGHRRAGLALLAAVLSTAAGPGGTAAERHRDEVSEIAYRRLHPEWRTHSEIGRMDDAAMHKRAAEIARDLAADLRDPALRPPAKYRPLEALQQLGPLAAGQTDALVTVLHDHDADTTYGIPYFCTVTKAMAAVAPTDPRVIAALANALAQDRSVGSVCHTCGCALDALAVSGPAAASVAGPVLDRLARGRLLTTYSNQLAKAIEAIGGAPAMVPALLARAADEQILPDDRAASLRTLARSYGALTANDQGEFRATAERLLSSEVADLRDAAADALGAAGPPALDPLVRALGDARYTVRATAARSLARLGPAAAPARGPLIAALDPFLGTGEAAAAALVAIGPAAREDVAARARTAPGHLRPLFDATVRAIEKGDLAPVRETMTGVYGHAPGGVGFVHLDLRRSGSGEPYRLQGFRIKVRVRGGAYTPSGPAAMTVDDTLTVDNAPNAFFSALDGRRAGDVLRVFLSPETTPNPYYATSRWIDHDVQHVLPIATGGAFDVEVTRVCEPVLWTIFRGSGIWSPVRLEIYCR